MITAPRSRHPGRDWVLCRVHVGRSRHCSSWCPERGIGCWPGRRYGRGRGQRLPEPDSHAHDGARGRGPVVSRVGLGLAALGRPTYITSGREEDLPGRSVAGMRTRTFSMLDAAYAAGVDPADAQEIRTLRTSVGGHSGGQVQATRGYAGHESAMFSPPQSAELCDMGGFVMDLLDRAKGHRRGALDRPAHQVSWAVAVLYLGEPLFDRRDLDASQASAVGCDSRGTTARLRTPAAGSRLRAARWR
jgi:hypothetical protein